MKIVKNALSNQVYFLKKENVFYKKYQFDQFKACFSCDEKLILTKLSYPFQAINNHEIKISAIIHHKFNDQKITDELLLLVIKAIKNFHKLDHRNIKLANFKNCYNDYLVKNSNILPILNHEKEIVNRAILFLKNGKQVLLHNDLVEGNLLLTKKGIVFIDFEYCGVGNELFDLASFVTERKLSDHQVIFLLKHYDPNINQTNFKVICAFLQLFWMRWALIKYYNTKKKIYLTIYNFKHSAYLKLEQELFPND